jgi:hypothetical protein
MPYFPLVVVFCTRYVKSSGLGTLLSLMIPYSFSLLAIWCSSWCFGPSVRRLVFRPRTFIRDPGDTKVARQRTSA